MKLELALEIIANEIMPALKPHCERIEVAGSVSRRRLECGDLEIVCIAKQTAPIDLFGTETMPVQGFIDAVNRWKKVRGEPTGKNTLRILPYDGAVLDLFIARPENFGYIKAVRVGSARFSYEVLAKAWCRAGYNGEDGMLVRRSDKVAIPLREERELFELIGVQWKEPWERE